MKKSRKLLGLCLPTALSIGAKVVLTCEICADGWMFAAFSEAFFGLEPERFCYILDALMVLLLFAVAAQKWDRLLPKIAAAAALLAGYTADLLVCNYGWQSLRWNRMFRWEAPLLTPLDAAKAGLAAYWQTGQPGYHIAVLSMAALFALILIFSRFQKLLALKIKGLLRSSVEARP